MLAHLLYRLNMVIIMGTNIINFLLHTVCYSLFKNYNITDNQYTSLKFLFYV